MGDTKIEEQLIVVSPKAHLTPDAIAGTVDGQGGHVIHRYGPRVLIAQLPKQVTESLRAALHDAEVVAQPNELSPQATKDLDPVGALGVAAFRLRKSPEHIRAKELGSPDDAAWNCGGALPPPDQPLSKVGATARRDTSQRMTGKIVVSIIIVSGKEWYLQFSPEETNKVIAKVQEGLSWWALQNPAANVSWIYDTHSVQIDMLPGSPQDRDKE
jgi:hypothetical protein